MQLLKADKSELIDAYSKTEDDALLLLKADKSELIDSYSKSENDALLLLKANVVHIVDIYSKTEDYALLLLKADKTELIDSYSKIEDDALLLLKANDVDIMDSYSKSEDDTLLLLKGDKSELIDSYSKFEDYALLLLKADKNELIDSYSKTEDDALILLNANIVYIVDSYSKSEVDALLDAKAENTDLTNYVDLTSALSITRQKLFNITNLQEVRDIATGKSKAYVFSTQGELNDWMAIQDNVAKLVIRDNLYIVGKEVTDYWWDGTDLKVLETELPDMRNVITTQGTATGSAKNTTFVTTGFDQSITEMKTFTCTIISNGIQYSGYDNNSVFLAGGGVKAIADIQSTSYIKSETYSRDEVYTKSEDDALLLLKADKTQLIDSYSKGETDNLLNNKANIGVSYSKGEDDTLLFAKADKSQLTDSCTKGETDNLLNNKASQSTTYTKIETDQLISQIEISDVDLSAYMTLGTSQTINANKTFNNSCRFVSSIERMSTVTGSSFIKSGADDTVVLLGAGGIKPISEFSGTPTDLSNYYTKTQTYSQTEANNKFVRLEGSIQQSITGILKNVSPFDYQDETQDPVANTYLTMSEIDSKLTNYVNTANNQSINGAKIFNANVSATGFVKTDKDDTSVLLAGGGDQLLSSFGGAQWEDITNLIVDLHSNIRFNYLILVRIGSVICSIGTYSTGISPLTPPSTTFPIQLATKRKILTCIHSYRDIRITTDTTEAWALLDATGLSEFPELYAYIHEREPKPIVDGIANKNIVGPQYFQDQVKDNDDKLSVQPPPPTSITPIPVTSKVITVPLYTLAQLLLSQNIEKISWVLCSLAFRRNCGHLANMHQCQEMIVDINKIQWVTLVKKDYVGSSIGSDDQVTLIKGNTHIAIAGVNYTEYESLMRETCDVNGDEMINIVDDLCVNSIIDGMKSMSLVQDVVQKQMEAIGDGVQPYDPSQPVSLSNYFNNNTKLMNNKIFGPLRAAYFAKGDPICTFNFQAEVCSQHVYNVFKVFQTIDSDLLPRLSKFFPIRTSYTSFSGMIQINGNDTPDVVVNQSSEFYPMD
ncbi:MAG: hypothetical protein EZS28_021677 [Streblomastix strix]|uniref:Uncharacterized protein n=1 Tax=Streblomastix strix TaxID=222440 RepID=A0A5J4VK07_9EUKA|nr:MAG: hypothetical protein EZS28_021677 [Streblomastix strix]